MEVVYEEATYIQIPEGDLPVLLAELDDLYPERDACPQVHELMRALRACLGTD